MKNNPNTNYSNILSILDCYKYLVEKILDNELKHLRNHCPIVITDQLFCIFTHMLVFRRKSNKVFMTEKFTKFSQYNL